MNRPSHTTSTKCQYQATASNAKWRFGVKWPLQHAQPDHRQHDRADRHVQAVEAGQHEERRAVDAGRELQAELLVGLAVLVRLQAHEREAQQERQREEHLQHAALARAQRVVRDGDRHAAGEQDQRC